MDEGNSAKSSENCHNSKTRNNIDMKPRALFNLETRNAIKPKRFDDDIILANYNVILVVLIYCQFGINGPESKCHSYIFINPLVPDVH